MKAISSICIHSTKACGILGQSSKRPSSKIISNCDRPENCWNCKESVKCTEKFFCNECKHIQPLPPQTLFEYLGLPPVFTIDDKDLKKRFRNLQFHLHPDKFAQASEEEKKISEEHSRKLNMAFKTLLEPLSRAKYLLKVLGCEEKSDLSPEELMEMMEWNEKIDSMSIEELKPELTAVEDHIKQLLTDLEKCFNDKNVSEARNKVTMLSYLYSLRSTINVKLGNTH